MFLQRYSEQSKVSLIPLGHFIPNPRLGEPAQIECAPEKVPLETRTLVIIPSADLKLRRELEGRGFFCIEGTATLSLMQRQFHDGYLETRFEVLRQLSMPTELPGFSA